MKPVIIGQACDNPLNIVVQVDQIDDISIVKILHLMSFTVSETYTIAELLRFMACEEYTGTEKLEELLEKYQMVL